MQHASKTQAATRVVRSLALLFAASTTVVLGQPSMEVDPATVAGQQQAPARLPPKLDGGLAGTGESAYGTLDVSSTVVAASAFVPANDQSSGLNVEYSVDARGWVYKTGGTINFWDFVGPVSLPSGARLENVILEACDDHSPGSITLSLNRCPIGSDDACASLGSVTTGNSATPGCGLYVFTPTATTIDNFFYRYNLFVTDTRNTAQTKFRSVELWWRRQVSAAPGTASFGDVPTGHPFFQHVEALAGSGITSGCGGGDFCPDAPLTRGQMAVFLAKALGLHWPY